MLSSLYHLVLIVEHGTFTEAARRAHLSQPALTASIRRLEEHFGARVLDRGRHGARLTAAGEALLPRARRALAAIDEGRRAVAEIEGLHAGEVRVGAGSTACTYLLPPELAAFRHEYPGVRVILRETTTTEALDALRDGELDLAIISDTPITPVRRDGELWMRETLILVGSPTLDPQTAPFLTFRKGATTRQVFDLTFPNAEVVMELGSIAAVKGNVRAGIGLALVSENAVADDLKRGLMVRVPHAHTPIERELRVVHAGLARLPPAAKRLRDQLVS